VTVLSGTLLVAAGDRLEGAEMRALPAGSYTGIPADVRHAAAARGETVLQIHGVGPFGIAYVNKADDPAARAAPPR
jgi:Zn-dependent alcohol dehydrogenase